MTSLSFFYPFDVGKCFYPFDVGMGFYPIDVGKGFFFLPLDVSTLYPVRCNTLLVDKK